MNQPIDYVNKFKKKATPTYAGGGAAPAAPAGGGAPGADAGGAGAGGGPAGAPMPGAAGAGAPPAAPTVAPDPAAQSADQQGPDPIDQLATLAGQYAQAPSPDTAEALAQLCVQVFAPQGDAGGAPGEQGAMPPEAAGGAMPAEPAQMGADGGMTFKRGGKVKPAETGVPMPKLK